MVGSLRRSNAQDRICRSTTASIADTWSLVPADVAGFQDAVSQDVRSKMAWKESKWRKAVFKTDSYGKSSA